MKAETKKIIDFYQDLSIESLPQLNILYDQKCFFKDPFHSFESREKLFNVYLKMFKKLKNPRFIVTKFFEKENELVLFWDFTFNKKFKITGSSLITFNQSKIVISHIDYWDSISELWIKIPLLGTLLKLLLKTV